MFALLRAATVAALTTLAVPAAAAPYVYNFTATEVHAGQNDYGWASGVVEDGPGSFTLSAQVSFDPSKITPAMAYGDGSFYGADNGPSDGDSFISISMTKTGGAVGMGTPLNVSSNYFASSGQVLFTTGPATASGDPYNSSYEYWSETNGIKSFTLGYVSLGILINGAAIEYDVVDGVPVLSDLGDVFSGEMFFYEYFQSGTFDIDGTMTSFVNYDRSVYGTFSATLDEDVDVPEPAALALFGLGLVGLGLRRRKAV